MDWPGDYTGHWGEIGPVDCGPGLHFIADDLEEVDISFDVEDVWTDWLWFSIIYALNWDVPKT